MHHSVMSTIYQKFSKNQTQTFLFPYNSYISVLLMQSLYLVTPVLLIYKTVEHSRRVLVTHCQGESANYSYEETLLPVT